MSETAFHAPGAQAAIRPTPEKRAAERKSLLLRSAKVVCRAGEYVCLVRDVSETGTSLKFLHEVPPEERIILMLANGLTYPIERVWVKERAAGYRFGARISLTEFIHEPSPFAVRPIRLAIRAAARVIDGRFSHPAQLLDLSSQGAKIECAAEMKPQRIISFQINGMAQQLAQVAWCGEGAETPRFGLQFRQMLGLNALAAAALQLQPFAASADAGTERAA